MLNISITALDQMNMKLYNAEDALFMFQAYESSISQASFHFLKPFSKFYSSDYEPFNTKHFSSEHFPTITRTWLLHLIIFSFADSALPSPMLRHAHLSVFIKKSSKLYRFPHSHKTLPSSLHYMGSRIQLL